MRQSNCIESVQKRNGYGPKVDLPGYGDYFYIGLQKETVIERPVLQEKLANPDALQPFSKVSTNQFTLAKSSLNKTFILLPSAISSAHTPTFEFFRPILIPLVRSADRIALFNISNESLYDTIPSRHFAANLSSYFTLN